jgi:predicted ATPase
MLLRSPASTAVEETYARAHRLSVQVGSTAQRITALWGLMHVHENRSEWQKAHALAVEIMELAARQGDSGLLLQSHHAAWSVLFFSGELDAALGHAEQGCRIYDRHAHHDHALKFGGHDPGVCAWNVRGMCLSLLGFPEQAREASLTALRMAEDVTHQATHAYANFSAAFISQSLRDPAAARRYAEVTVAIGAAFDAIVFKRMGMILVAWAKANQGDADAGAAELDAILAPARAKGRKMMMMRYYLGLFADVCLRAGRIEDGLVAVGEASGTATELGEWLWQAELLRLKGELLLARSPNVFTPPEECFHQSIGFARRQRAKTLELRSAVALAQLWERQGRRIDALELLSPVYASFTEGFETSDMKDAKELLNKLA